jgi:hypothetical protein
MLAIRLLAELENFRRHSKSGMEEVDEVERMTGSVSEERRKLRVAIEERTVSMFLLERQDKMPLKPKSRITLALTGSKTVQRERFGRLDGRRADCDCEEDKLPRQQLQRPPTANSTSLEEK